jgi:rhomboid family GlyGly-CTERM serine protease
MHALLKDILDPRRLPWIYLALVIGSGVIAVFPALRPALVYHRGAISDGELWRLWTGHLVHFGWPHYLADGALFVFIGWAFERSQAALGRISLALLPLAVCAALYWFDPTMVIYGGLSGINVGLLVFLACRGWQKDWKDWFWPAILGIHVVEVIWEARTHGTGGGAIRFDDSSIRVATIAHLGGVAYGVVAWALVALRTRGKPIRPAAGMPAE